jgi:hypothetical protein
MCPTGTLSCPFFISLAISSNASASVLIIVHQ